MIFNAFGVNSDPRNWPFWFGTVNCGSNICLISFWGQLYSKGKVYSVITLRFCTRTQS